MSDLHPKTMHSKHSIAAALFLMALGACAKESAKAPATDTTFADVQGACADVYKAQVCIRAKTQTGKIVEVSVDVPISSIENSPAVGPMDWPPTAVASLDIPGASNPSDAPSSFTMFWESAGHPPGPYLTPHFDFHFNKISAAELTAIDCADLTKPTALPASYELPDVPLPPDMARMMRVKSLIGLCVPHMGMHAMPSSELASKELFRGTMVVGYYHGKPIFVEPMVTKAMLMEKKSFDLSLIHI